MKILIIRTFPDVININNYNVQEIGLAKALIKKGNECDILLYTNEDKNYREQITIDNGKIITIYWTKGIKILGNVFFDKEIYNIANKYDFIQLGGYDQIYNSILIKKIHKPVVIYQGNYYSDYSKGYKKKCLISDMYYFFKPWYKEITFICKSKLAEQFLRRKGYKNTYVLGVGLDDERFINEIEENEKIREIKINKKHNKYLLYIGKIEERRSILLLLEMFLKILEKHSNVKLVLVGKGEENYKHKCFEYAKENNILNRIIYIESLEQKYMPQLYKCCDIFIFPTKHEIFGMVLLEAMYFGIPTITTLNGGSSTIIENEKNGFICNLNNINKWIDIISIILKDDEYRKKISENAEKTIKNKFTWEKLSDKFLEIYIKEKNKVRGN